MGTKGSKKCELGLCAGGKGREVTLERMSAIRGCLSPAGAASGGGVNVGAWLAGALVDVEWKPAGGPGAGELFGNPPEPFGNPPEPFGGVVPGRACAFAACGNPPFAV